MTWIKEFVSNVKLHILWKINTLPWLINQVQEELQSAENVGKNTTGSTEKPSKKRK
jgi:hypothetical protein